MKGIRGGNSWLPQRRLTSKGESRAGQMLLVLCDMRAEGALKREIDSGQREES